MKSFRACFWPTSAGWIPRSRILLLVALHLLLSWAISSSAIAQTLWRGRTEVEITVKAEKGGVLADAQITLRYLEIRPVDGPATITTNQEGKAKLFGLAEGRWHVEVVSEGYRSFLASIRIRTGKKVEILSSAVLSEDGSRKAMKVQFAKARKGKTGASMPQAAPAPLPAPKPTPEPTPAPTPKPASTPTPEPATVPVEVPEPKVEPSSESSPAPVPEPAVAETRAPEPDDPKAPDPAPEPQKIEATPAPPRPEEVVEPPPPTVDEDIVEPEELEPAPKQEPAIEPAIELAPEPAPEPDEVESTLPQPAAKPPVPAVPAGPKEPLRARSGRGCPDCRTGEQGATVTATVAAVTGPEACPADLESRVREAMGIVAGEGIGSFFGPLLDPTTKDLAAELPPSAAARVRELLAEVSGTNASCRLLAVVLPRNFRYSGYRYGASDISGSGDCPPSDVCRIGQANWDGNPRSVRRGELQVIYGTFTNHSPDRIRHPALTVYFDR